MEYNKAAGQELRRLRQGSGLTLQAAAARMLISASLLSRRERGMEQLCRADIQHAIDAYQLAPGEARALWMTAGFVPPATASAYHPAEVHHCAEQVLVNLAFPALMLDAYGYIRAWTHELEAFWSLSQIDATPLHLVCALFSQQVRSQAGEHWDALVVQVLRIFAWYTLPRAGDPAFRRLLDRLRLRYGELFVSRWNRAYDVGMLAELPELRAGIARLHHRSAEGPLTYVLARGVCCKPQQHAIIACIPADAESLARHQRWRAASGASRLYYRL